jgi:phage baseplate assembly protein gpV
MTLVAQPTIQGVTYDQNNNATYVNLPLLGDVPIVFPGAGDFILTLPIAAGDEVLVIFSSRCIDGWWSLGGIQVPMEMRMHDLSDGFAIPGPKSLPNIIPNISTTTAQLRNKAGTTYIELTNTGINLVGNVMVTGAIIATGEITGNSIPLSNHIHPGVTSGSSDTGTPIL